MNTNVRLVLLFICFFGNFNILMMMMVVNLRGEGKRNRGGGERRKVGGGGRDGSGSVIGEEKCEVGREGVNGFVGEK